MGLNLSDLGLVYIVCGKTDLRKGIDSLAYLIQSQFDLDPFSKSVFLFCGGKSDRFLFVDPFSHKQCRWDPAHSTLVP